jgi:hypothetical protein
MDRIEDSGSSGWGSIPHGSTILQNKNVPTKKSFLVGTFFAVNAPY